MITKIINIDKNVLLVETQKTCLEFLKDVPKNTRLEIHRQEYFVSHQKYVVDIDDKLSLNKIDPIIKTTLIIYVYIKQED